MTTKQKPDMFHRVLLGGDPQMLGFDSSILNSFMEEKTH